MVSLDSEHADDVRAPHLGEPKLYRGLGDEVKVKRGEIQSSANPIFYPSQPYQPLQIGRREMGTVHVASQIV